MTMSKYEVCCHKCLEDISTISTDAGKLWMDICSYQKRFGRYMRVAKIHAYTEKSWRLLEGLGYILSTEECRPNDVEDELLLRINGFTIEENGNEYFCSGQHERN